jgi:Protein of unknown function (DUF3987)
MTLLSEILNSTAELEAPIAFYYWATLAVISAVVKDNIWIERGGDYYNLYPNIYVMFHADSGLKKGPAVSMARDLVKQVNNTRIISGRSSIQGILKQLGTAYTVPGGKVITKSTAFICSSELSSSIVEDKAAANILTDLYDRHYNEGEWKSLLKMETFNLKDPTITMLTATNASHAEDFFTKRDVQGGFYARTFIIYETEENATNSLILPLKNPINKEKHIAYLKQLSALTGRFEPLGDVDRNFTKVGKIYDDWYNDFRSAIKKQKIKDDTGTLNRFGDSVMKVAMLIHLSKEPTLVIDENSMLEAITVCEKLIGNVRKTTMGMGGKSQFLTQKTLIIEELLGRDNHMITREQMLKKFWMHMGSEELDSIMMSFDQSGRILTENHGNVTVYVMPPSEVEIMNLWLSGKISADELKNRRRK